MLCYNKSRVVTVLVLNNVVCMFVIVSYLNVGRNLMHNISEARHMVE